ncbi:hypothetical protein L218DRAFT_108930 [Marasmius fiardii PR-910]|nr:hypothetical protein L218DRAFT_108930 [Marasmius fiardii PR-910]
MIHYYDEITMRAAVEQPDEDADSHAVSVVNPEPEYQYQSDGHVVETVAAPTPLPLVSITVLSIVMLSEFLSANVSSPFIFFMVKGFQVEDVAFWTGILVSTFFLSQFASSLFWTSLAGYTSPRLVLILTLTGSAASTMAFGCSTTLKTAMVARLAQGLFAGGISVARGFCWGMGGIAGAVVGGAFERPEEKWAIFERVEFFNEFPYFLPCAVAGSVTLIGGVLACFLAPDAGPRSSRVLFDDEKPASAPKISMVSGPLSRIGSIQSLNAGFLKKQVSLVGILNSDEPAVVSECTPLLASIVANQSYSGSALVVAPDGTNVNDLPSRGASRTRWFDSLGRRSIDPTLFPPSSHPETEDEETARGRPTNRTSTDRKPDPPTTSSLLRSASRMSSRRRNLEPTPTPITFPRSDTLDFALVDHTFPRTDTLESTVSISVSRNRFFPRTDTLDSAVSVEPPVPHPLLLAPILEGAPSMLGLPGNEEEKSGERPDGLPVGLIVQYGLLALHTTTHDQVFLAYFTGSYEEGGLGFGAGEFAGLIAVMCVFQMVYQFWVYSKIGPPNGPFTHLTLFRASCFLYIFAYLSVAIYRGMFGGATLLFGELPSIDTFSSFLSLTCVRKSLALAISTAIRYCGNTFAFTAIGILINASTPPASISYANGVAQSIVSLARCFGPTLGGLLWSVGTDPNPGMYWTSFVACAGICVVAVVHGVGVKAR